MKKFKGGLCILIEKSAVEQARHISIISFLGRYAGLNFAPKYGGYRCIEHPSFAVGGNGLSWYWHSQGIGGFGAIDYLMKIENMQFREAVETIMCDFAPSAAAQKISVPLKTKSLILPARAKTQARLFDYLCNQRGINYSIVTALLNENKIYADVRNNIVFVGVDENGEPKFASLRGTYGNFRADCAGSDKRYGFCMEYADSDKVFIFESAIDAMSHAHIEVNATKNPSEWRSQNRLSLSGTSDKALQKYLELHPNIKEIIFCFDNDHAGREAAVSMARKYNEKGFITRLELPGHKDFNEDLLFQGRS